MQRRHRDASAGPLATTASRSAKEGPLQSVDPNASGNFLLGSSSDGGRYLILGCLILYVVLFFSYAHLFATLGVPAMNAEASAATLAEDLPPTELGEYERQACLATFTMQVGSIIMDLLTRKHLSASQFWVVKAIFFVKLIATCTNAALLLDSGVVDMRQQAAGQAPQLAAGAGP